MSDKRLYKSKVNKMIARVCGGIAEYFNVVTRQWSGLHG